MTTRWTMMPSPIGPLLVVAGVAGVTQIHMLDDPANAVVPPGSVHDAAALDFATDQLDAYFAGELTDFELPLDLHGTPFQVEVWRGLAAVPYGSTTSYGEFAASLGRAGSSRAVGAANGRNPVPIVLPCHRVVGSNGTLTGYGGGLPRKRWLLELEARVAMERAFRA